MAFQQFSPPNLPSLSQPERTAFAALRNYLPQFESQMQSHFLTFGSLEERDAYFTAPEHGDTCLVTFHADPGTGYDHGSTLWVYANWLATSFNVFDMWMPFDFQWNQFPVTVTNITVGDGSVVGFYKRSGSDCAAKFKFTMGSTSAMGSSPTFNFPFVAEAPLGGAHDEISAQVSIADSGTGIYRGIVRYSTVNGFLCLSSSAAGATVQDAGISAASPMVWAAPDILSVPYMTYPMDMENITFTA